MGIEHLAAVWETSRQNGSNLVVLLAVASYSDHNGEWVIDQATLQRRARLSRRRVQQILEDLITAGELAVKPGDGRGHPSSYRLLIAPPDQERAQQSAPFPAGKGEAHCTLSAQKGEAGCILSEKKGEADCTLSPPKGEAECALSSAKGEAPCALSGPPSPPFPPDPQIPPYPPKAEEADKETDKESFALALRPLAGPQSATIRVNQLLKEAGVPLPSPAQIGLWLHKLGGVEPLLDLLRRLIQAGLASKKNPAAYVHRVVLERSERPAPIRPVDTRFLIRTAGSDETRRQQALQIIARARGEK